MEALRREDPALEAATALFQAWYDAFGEEVVTAKEVIAESVKEGRESLRDAIQAAAGRRGEVDMNRFRYWLRAWKDRVLGQLRLEPVGEDTHAKTLRWRVREDREA